VSACVTAGIFTEVVDDDQTGSVALGCQRPQPGQHSDYLVGILRDTECTEQAVEAIHCDQRTRRDLLAEARTGSMCASSDRSRPRSERSVRALLVLVRGTLYLASL
jgi:hypothetical protein